MNYSMSNINVNIERMFRKIINKLRSTIFCRFIRRFFVTKYTQEWTNNKETQCYEIKCYMNGKYTHTVSMHYFTKEQISRIENCVSKLYE